MKTWSDETLSWVLPFMDGSKQLTEQIVKDAAKDAEKLSLLTACSLIHRDKDEITLKRVSENIFAKKADMYFSDFSDTIEEFTNLAIESEDLGDLVRRGWMMEKLPGDPYAVIFDDEDNPVAYVMHFTDTRCPWIKFPGDTRKVQFQITYFDGPNEDGFAKRLNGWMQPGKGPYTYKRTGVTMSTLDRIPSYILQKFLNQQDVVVDEELNQIKLGMRDIRDFLKGSNFVSQVEGEEHMFEISKDPGSDNGSALMDSVEIGTVTLKRTSPTSARVMVTLTSLPNGVGKNHAINCLTSAALCPVHV